MNVNDIINSKNKTTAKVSKETAETLLKQVKVATPQGKINDYEKALLTNLLCKHKSLKMKLTNAGKAKWNDTQILNDVVVKHVESIEELLENFAKQGK